jgi:hypothetical protein
MVLRRRKGRIPCNTPPPFTRNSHMVIECTPLPQHVCPRANATLRRQRARGVARRVVHVGQPRLAANRKSRSHCGGPRNKHIDVQPAGTPRRNHDCTLRTKQRLNLMQLRPTIRGYTKHNYARLAPTASEHIAPLLPCHDASVQMFQRPRAPAPPARQQRANTRARTRIHTYTHTHTNARIR